jgi:hypothetical protein
MGCMMLGNKAGSLSFRVHQGSAINVLRNLWAVKSKNPNR